jgi:hypothetical protein
MIVGLRGGLLRRILLVEMGLGGVVYGCMYGWVGGLLDCRFGIDYIACIAWKMI